MATPLLAVLGHTTIEARDGAEAEETLIKRQEEAQVDLTELCLDGADRGALARRLQAARARLHPLVMSVDSEDVFAGRDLAGPRRGFIEKPFSLNGLSLALEGLLAR